MRLRLLLPLLSSTKPRSRERTGASFSKSWLAVFAFSALGSSSGCSESEGFGADDEIRESGNSVHLDPPPLVFPDSSGGSAAGGAASGGTASGGAGTGGAPSGGASSGGSGAGGSSPIVADPPRSVSQYCGDRVHDAALEECDDGPENGLAGSVCSDDCQTRDVPVLPGAATDHRTVGFGRHPVSASHVVDFVARTSAGAAVWVEKSTPPAPASVHVEAMILDAYGNAVQPVTVTSGAHPTSFASPVVAGLGNGNYAVAWNDLNGDGSELGVALRKLVVDGASAYVEGTIFANSTTIGAQQDPDAIWTGSQLVVAWTDTSDPETAPDLRVRTFDANLGAASAETILANETVPETAVALAPHEGGWAAAYRRAEADGSESIVVVQGAHRVVVEPTSDPPEFLGPGGDEDRPALVSLDAQHLFVAFTVGTDPDNTGVANVPRLWGAVVDLGDDSVAWQGALAPLAAATVGDATRAQREPSAVVVGRAPNGSTVLPSGQNQVFVAWRSDAALGSALGEDLWLKRLDWNGATLTTNLPETALLRDGAEAPFVLENVEHGGGDQRVPQLAMLDVPGSPALGAKALGIVWEDWGSTFEATQASPDVALQLAPLPLRRGPPIDAGCATTACEEGEGPCASTSECASGLECAAEKGPWYGYGASTSVCVVPHCGNWVRDADEDGVDCGGSGADPDCGECFECLNPTTHEGTAHFCSAVCRCDNLEGDCDDDTDCSGHLECVEDAGNLVGHPGIDVCVVPHCIDGEWNEGEEDRLDCGGTDCAPCVPGSQNFCSTQKTCSEGQGACDSAAECSGGLSCQVLQGGYYGLPGGTSVCLPSACGVRGGAFETPVFCSTACRCPDGYGPCESDAECLGTPGGPAGKCRAGRGIYYGRTLETPICIPDSCSNGVQDAGEYQVDCGGVCGHECPVCDGNRTFASFEYAASSGNAVGSRGWEYANASATGTITWSKSTAATDGAESLRFQGCGGTRVRSPVFTTSDFEVVGDNLLIDIKTNRVSGTLPSSGAPLGDLHLKILEPNGEKRTLFTTTLISSGSSAWEAKSFSIGSTLRAFFLAGRSDLRLELDLVLRCDGVDPITVELDHLRFSGNPVFQSSCPTTSGGQDPGFDTARSVLGFESASAWTSIGVTPTLTTNRIQGASAVQISSTVTSTLKSIAVPARNLVLDRALLLDVFLPPPLAGQTLSGTISATITCPVMDLTHYGLGSRSVSRSALQVPSGQWRTLSFEVPQDVLDGFSNPQGSCSLWITTQLTNPQAASSIAFDHLRFAPWNACTSKTQIDGAPFEISSATLPDGSASRPYVLCTPAQFQTLVGTSGLWSSHLQLGRDIDLSGVAGQIGTFAGHLNGDDHELSNYERITTASNIGLVTTLTGSVRNLQLHNFRVEGVSFVGALAAQVNANGLVEDVNLTFGALRSTGQSSGALAGAVNASGTVRYGVATAWTTAPAGADLGGLVGRNYGLVEDSVSHGLLIQTGGTNSIGGLVGVNGGTVRRSNSDVDVRAEAFNVGGLVGWSSSGSLIDQSQASGPVYGGATRSNTGGLVGTLGTLNTTPVAVVRNSSATGSVIGTANSVGGLIGIAQTATVETSHATGNVQASGQKVGGLIGEALTVTITDSYASGNATTAQNYSGGLVGYATGSAMARTRASGNSQSTGTWSGGLVGLASTSSIRQSFSTGTAAAAGYSGGFIGGLIDGAARDSYSWGAATSSVSGGFIGVGLNSTIERVYAKGAANGSGSRGTLVGTQVNPNTSVAQPNTYVATRSSQDANPGLWPVGSLSGTTNADLQRLTNAAFLTSSNFTSGGWDFSFVWKMGTAGPELLPDTCTQMSLSATAPFVLGLPVTPDGSANKPYPLCNASQIQTVINTSSLWSKNFVLLANVSLTGVTGTIGTVGIPFTGALDGRGYVLSGFSRTGTTNVGLFAVLDGDATVDGVGDGRIHHLDISGFTVSGTENVGTLVGLSTGGRVEWVRALGGTSSGSTAAIGGLVGRSDSDGTIQNSSSSVAVTGTGSAAGVGGLVGRNWDAYVGFSTSSGTVTGTVVTVEYVGGLVGSLTAGASVADSSSSSVVQAAGSHAGGLIGAAVGSEVQRCFATGNVTQLGGTSSGGLGGYFDDTDITDSYATGTVSGVTRVGGLVGMLLNSSVHDDYATGNVTASSASDGYAGGLVGRADTTVSIQRSFAAGNVTTPGSQAGGLVGYISNANVYDNYAHGTVHAGTGTVGGLIGRALTTVNVARSYSKGAVTGGGSSSTRGRLIGTRSVGTLTGNLVLDSVGPTTNVGTGSSTGITAVTSTALNTQATYTALSWDFTNIWIMGTGWALLR